MKTPPHAGKVRRAQRLMLELLDADDAAAVFHARPQVYRDAQRTLTRATHRYTTKMVRSLSFDAPEGA